MLKFSEHPLAASTRELIEGASADGHAKLGLSTEADAELIIDAIDESVRGWQRGNEQARFVLHPEETPYTFGSVWGNQLVRVFRWEWVSVVFHEQDDRSAPAVVSPDRSLAIYPIHYLIGCFDDVGVEVKVAMAFGALTRGDVRIALPGGYLNVMDTLR